MFAKVGQTWPICADLVRIADCQGRSGRNSFHEQEDEYRIMSVWISQCAEFPAQIVQSLPTAVLRYHKVRPEPERNHSS